MPKPRKKRSLTTTDDKQDSLVDTSQRLDQDSDVQKIELAASTESPVAKRAKMGKVKERQYDKYCWVCHSDDCSEKCSFCPRVYHTSCLPRMEITTGDWTCPECQAILLAEKNRTASPVMSLLSTDQLCNLLKYSLNRMEMHVPKDFCFGSSSAVLHPMDFPLLEKNIRKKVYTSPAAFLADAKWIFHNHSVYFPLCVPAVKTIMKVCQEEMREIETCPDCYLHAYSMKEKWFSEPCRKPHTLVWAKLKGFPIWPAKAVKTSNGNVDVRFFGGHERAWVPVTHCYFLSRDPPQAISSQKRNFEYAHQEVELHIKLLTQQFGGFEYAPDKTPFNPSQIYLQLNVTLSKLSYLPQSLRDKRKQESTTSSPAKRRVGRAHSAHEVQGSKKDEERKEIDVDQSVLEKDQISKTTDSNSEKDKGTSLLSLVETAKSHNENCADSELGVHLQECTKSSQLLPEKTCKESIKSPEAMEINDNKVNLILAGADDVNKQGNSVSILQSETQTEVPSSIETDTLSKTVKVEKCDQESPTVTESAAHCTKDQNNQEITSIIPADTSDDNLTVMKVLSNFTQELDKESMEMNSNNDFGVTKEEVLDDSNSVFVTEELCKEHSETLRNSNNNEADVTEEDLDNSSAVSFKQELDKESTASPTNNHTHQMDVKKEVSGNTSSLSVTFQSGIDSTNIPVNIVDCIHKEVSVEADLNVASELIIDTSTTENEDSSNHDVASVIIADTKCESEDADANHSNNRKDAEEIVKSDKNQAAGTDHLVSSKQSNEILSHDTNFCFSQEETSLGDSSSLTPSDTSLPSTKEIVIVVKDLNDNSKTIPEETDAAMSVTSAASSSTSVTPEILKGSVPITEATVGSDKSIEIIDSTSLCDKSGITSKENDTKAPTVTEGDTKAASIAPKARRSSVHKREKHMEDVHKAESKPDKSEEFHVDDSNLEKNSASSNSLRIRIVKGKVESDSPCPSGKESQDTHKIIYKAAKSLQEEANIVSLSKSDFVQNNNEDQVKAVTQKPEELSENISRQETNAGNTVIRKSKRPRKNFIIQFPYKHDLSDAHSNQDGSRDPSNVVVIPEDCETNAETSHQPDEPDIVKNFKATLEKIHKVKYAKGAVLEKVIDYKSHSTHSNDASKPTSVKPLTNVTHIPVVIKVPTTTVAGQSTSSNDCVASTTTTNQLSQSPCNKTLQVSSTKSVQIIAIDNRSNCSASSTSKYPDSSPSCNILHKETEVSHCSNLDSECTLNKGETSIGKPSSMKDQIGKEAKIQEKCSNSNVNLLLQNVQASLKDNPTTNHNEGSPSNARSQTDIQNLHLPFGDKERNLFNILPVEKYARKLTVFLTNTLEEMCQDIINSGCMQVAMNTLETELETLRDKHKKDIADVKQNADIIMKEMRSAMETEKQNAVAEVRRQCEMEMRKNVEEAKKKQWCANCGKEAVFYCCWNTSYCDYPCQQTHWPQHMSICGQNHVPSVKEQQIVRMPNLGPEMTITQSSPGLPLEIQLTTHSPTQANKNKKKPPSSSEKMPMASRAKGRSLTQSPNTGLQPHDINRSSQMIYSPHYRLQGGHIFPVMLSHSTPQQQQQCGPNVVMENKSHNVQHTVPFQYNPHVCM